LTFNTLLLTYLFANYFNNRNEREIIAKIKVTKSYLTKILRRTHEMPG
jgi:DNA-binding MarR family transcriptional regulator